jgi:DNA polymerase elongation subunit (family B)
MVLSRKHYAAMECDGKVYTKGLLYIRKSGSRLSSIVQEAFVKAVLSSDDNDIDTVKVALTRLYVEYK